MLLKHLTLQNFRNYAKSEFNFTQNATLIVGPNTAGKSNLLESILFLSTGKSEKAEKDFEAIRFGQEMARINGTGQIANGEESKLEVVITTGLVHQVPTPLKQYKVGGVPKRRADFAGNLSAVSFAPSDLDIIIGSPSLRRNFLDDTLEAVDRAYRTGLASYIKALRQRNALLDLAKKTGKRSDKQFEYWDQVLIEHGTYVQQKRRELVDYINSSEKNIFDCVLFYDWSEISKDRLDKYKEAEEGAGVTLVGPHRDDLYVEFDHHHVKYFGSRGQQRLVILQLKIIQMEYIEKERGERPILLLDDIFSELDEGHIGVVLKIIGQQQTILTTTHQELVPKHLLKSMEVVELKK